MSSSSKPASPESKPRKTNRITSPCMAVCKYDDNDVCLGCFRQRKDIENWFFLSPAQQQAIVTEVMPKIDAKRQQQRQVYLQQEQAKKEQAKKEQP